MVEHTRSLGFTVAFAMGLGTMIAAGIFSLSGTAVAQIGSSAVIAFVLAALIASITAASYSEFASIYSENGGGYLFSSRTFDHDLLTYAIGMLLFLGYTGTTAFYLATMDEWFVQFITPQGWPIPHGAVGVLTAVLLGALNARGTEESGSFQVLVTGAKVAVLFAFVGGAFSYAGPTAAVGEFTMNFQIEPVNIVGIAALAFITFFGFSAIAASAGEIIEPRKTVPKAIAASMITVTVLYTFVIVAMVNTPASIAGQPRAEVLQAGETAMGLVATAFLGSIGQSLIVAGAVFSMVSASNASILAASGIGSLMGRQGQAPRPFSRIHPRFGTPFWSVGTATATIAGLIAVFVGVFPEHGGLAGIELGLNALTGFATFNLLVPLSAVNVALIYSRRRFADLDRPLSVPLVPWLPALGIVANLALITNLPFRGVVVGTGVAVALLAAYVIWGGEPGEEELFHRVVQPGAADEDGRGPGGSGGGEDGRGAGSPGGEERSHGAGGGEAGKEAVAEGSGAPEVADPAVAQADEVGDTFRVLVPVARPSNAVTHVHVAALVARARAEPDETPLVQVVNTTQVPEQTPYETVVETARGRADEIRDALAAADVDVSYTVEGHTCRDVSFDIVQTARDDGADLILMGYPEDHPAVTTSVQFRAPCDVCYVSGFDRDSSLDTVTLGAGGGPHHNAMVPLVNELGLAGAHIHVVHVLPAGESGTPEVVEDTLDRLDDDVAVDVHEIESESIADTLLDVAAEEESALFVGATRDRGLRRWVFGSVPDRVIASAPGRDVPVLVYAGETSTVGRLRETIFPAYRYLVKVFQ